MRSRSRLQGPATLCKSRYRIGPYLGWLEERGDGQRLWQAELQAYEDWLRTVRGLSEETIDGYSRGAGQFLASLDDIDWENELLRVRCSKPGRIHLWPLSEEAGSAILDYIRDGRPTSFERSLFFTSCAPIRPVSRKTLGKIVRDRLAGIGVVTGRRGPHALRHAAAQHLLDQGMAMKVNPFFIHSSVYHISGYFWQLFFSLPISSSAVVQGFV